MKKIYQDDLSFFYCCCCCFGLGFWFVCLFLWLIDCFLHLNQSSFFFPFSQFPLLPSTPSPFHSFSSLSLQIQVGTSLVSVSHVISSCLLHSSSFKAEWGKPVGGILNIYVQNIRSLKFVKETLLQFKSYIDPLILRVEDITPFHQWIGHMNKSQKRNTEARRHYKTTEYVSTVV